MTALHPTEAMLAIVIATVATALALGHLAGLALHWRRMPPSERARYAAIIVIAVLAVAQATAPWWWRA